MKIVYVIDFLHYNEAEESEKLIEYKVYVDVEEFLGVISNLIGTLEDHNHYSFENGTQERLKMNTRQEAMDYIKRCMKIDCNSLTIYVNDLPKYRVKTILLRSRQEAFSAIHQVYCDFGSGEVLDLLEEVHNKVKETWAHDNDIAEHIDACNKALHSAEIEKLYR